MLPSELLSAIAQRPDDDELRMVAADLLEERGEIDRAELIRLQLASARAPGEDIDRCWRERVLLDGGLSRWSRESPLPPGVRIEGFRRGFPSRISVREPSLLAELPKEHTLSEVSLRSLGERGSLRSLPELPWLRRLSVAPRASFERLSELLDSPLLHPGLDALSLADQSLGDSELTLLGLSPSLGGIVDLDLGGNFFGAQGLAGLLRSPHLGALRRLELGNFTHGSVVSLGAEGVLTLLRWDGLGQLTSLGLSGQNIHAAPAAALLASDSVPPRLDLSDNPIGGLRPRSSGSHLQRLSLTHCRLGGEDLSVLLALPQLSRLDALDLSRNGIGRTAPERLTMSPTWPTLRALGLQGAALHRAATPLVQCEGSLLSLDLSKCGLDGNDLEALSQAPWWREIRELSLLSNPLSERGAGALMGTVSRALSPLHRLYRLELGPDVGPLSSLPSSLVSLSLPSLSPDLVELPQLSALDLSRNRQREEDIALLAQMPWFPRLVSLSLSSCGLSSRSVGALLAGKGPLSLRALRLSGNAIGKVGVRELLSKRKRLSDLAEIWLDSKDVPPDLAARLSDPRQFPSQPDVRLSLELPPPRPQRARWLASAL